MNENIVVKIGADVSKLASDLGKATSDIKKFGATTSASMTGAVKDMNVYEDASGRLRHANGQFVSSAEKAALGLGNVGDNAKTAGAKFNEFGNNAKSAGTSMATTFGVATLAIAGALGFAVKKAADFDTQIRKAGAIAGASAKELDAMKDAALSLGATTSESASSVAVAMTELAAKGFTANEAIAAMPGIIAAAEASGEDLALAADTVSSALNIFGLEAADSSRVADILAESANTSAAGIDSLGYVLKYAGAPAAALGISLEEVAAAAGIMADAGIDGSSSGTALRASLLALNNPAKAQAKIMAGLGFEMQDSEGKTKSLSQIVGDLTASMVGMTEADKVATLAKLVGTEAVSGFLALTKAGPAQIDKMSEALRNSAGASAEAAAQMKAGIGGALENLSGAFESLTITIGDQLVPYVQTAATALAGLAEKFTNLSDGTKKFLVVGTAIAGIFTAIVAAIGIVLMVVGGAITGLTAIAGAMGIAGGAAGLLSAAFAVLTGPIGIAVAAIAGIIAVLVLAYNKIGWFRDAINKAWASIKAGTTIAFNAIKSAISTAMTAIVTFGQAQLAKFKSFWDTNGKQISSIAKFYFNAVLAVIQGVMGVIKGVFQIAWPLITATVKYAWETIKLVVSTAINLVLGVIQTVLKILQGDWKGAWQTILTTVKSIWADIGAFLKGIDLAGTGKQIIQGLINGIASMGGAIISAVKKIADLIPDGVKKILKIKSPSRVMFAIGEWTGIGLANGIDATKARNEAVMTELGAVITKVAKDNAKQAAAINKTASAEQAAIAKKATADIAAIYTKARSDDAATVAKAAKQIAEIEAKARDAKRKLTKAEVRRIADIEAGAREAKRGLTTAEILRIEKIEDAADVKTVASRKKHKAELAKIEAGAAAERLTAIKQFIENKQKLEGLSLVEEANIWRKAAQSFKDGTQEKIDAQIQYRDSLAKINTEITSINEAYAGKMAAINDKLRADEEALTKTYQDSLQARMSALMSFAGIFDAFDAKVGKSGDELLANLNSQVDGFKAWQSEITALSGKAIDEGLLAELQAMGPKALPELMALNSMTAEQLAEYSALYKEKAALARTQAESELVGMKADTAKRITELRATANTELALLQTEWVAKIKGVTQATATEFKTLTQIGKDAGQNLLNGLKSMEGALVAQARAIAAAVNAALQGATGGSVKVAGYSTPSTSSGASSTSKAPAKSATSGGTTYTGPVNVVIDAKTVTEFNNVVDFMNALPQQMRKK